MKLPNTVWRPTPRLPSCWHCLAPSAILPEGLSLSQSLVPCQALGIRAAVRLVAGRAIQISDACVPRLAAACSPHFPRQCSDFLRYYGRRIGWRRRRDITRLSASRPFFPKSTIPTGTSTASCSCSKCGFLVADARRWALSRIYSLSGPAECVC